MGKDQAIGAVIFVVSVLVAIAFVGLLFFYDPYITSFINIGATADVRYWLIATPVSVTFVVLMAVGSWIGWTMATTPPPKPFEEITEETKTE